MTLPEDPFDTFVDLQMTDDTATSLPFTPGGDPLVVPRRLDTLANTAVGSNYAAPWGESEVLPSEFSADELLQCYLNDQLALMSNVPATLAVNSATTPVGAHTATLPITSYSGSAHSPVSPSAATFHLPTIPTQPPQQRPQQRPHQHRRTRSAYSSPSSQQLNLSTLTQPMSPLSATASSTAPLVSPPAIASVQAQPNSIVETALHSLSHPIPSTDETASDAWMAQLIASTATTNSGTAVQPSQLVLRSPLDSEIDLDDTKVYTANKKIRRSTSPLPVIPVNAGPPRRRSHGRSASSSIPAGRTGFATHKPTTTVTTTTSPSSAHTTTTTTTTAITTTSTSMDRSHTTPIPTTPTTPTTTTNTTPTEHAYRAEKLALKEEEDDNLDEDAFVQELVSLAARVGQKSAAGQARREPLPDEQQIRKMTPKERRQVRNKISARNFRLRRKEYIGTLEQEVKDVRSDLTGCKTRLVEAEQENRSLRKEVRSLREQLEIAMATTAALSLSDMAKTDVGNGPSSNAAISPLGRKRPVLRNPVRPTSMVRSSSNSSNSSTNGTTQLLTPTADDIHKDRPTSGSTSTTRPVWNEHRIIVHQALVPEPNWPMTTDEESDALNALYRPKYPKESKVDSSVHSLLFNGWRTSTIPRLLPKKMDLDVEKTMLTETTPKDNLTGTEKILTKKEVSFDEAAMMDWFAWLRRRRTRGV